MMAAVKAAQALILKQFGTLTTLVLTLVLKLHPRCMGVGVGMGEGVDVGVWGAGDVGKLRFFVAPSKMHR